MLQPHQQHAPATQSGCTANRYSSWRAGLHLGGDGDPSFPPDEPGDLPNEAPGDPLKPEPIGDPLPVTQPDPQPLDPDLPPMGDPMQPVPPLVTGRARAGQPHCEPNRSAR